MNNRHSAHVQPDHGTPRPHPNHRSQSSFGAVPIPSGQGNAASGRDRNGSMNGGQQQYTGKSPPTIPNKNTKHVPCKFFRQGQCQAGTACPFMHTMDPMSHQAPCKYFMKGNCKFGAKCALAHYLPNGHKVSKADLEPLMGGHTRQNGIFVRDEPSMFPPADPNAEPFIGAQAISTYFAGAQDTLFPIEDDNDAYHDRYSNPYPPNGFDMTVGSPPNSQLDASPNNLLSPQRKWPSALTTPLPASYDPNSLPHIAKYGPYGQSVPDKFGIGSPQGSALSQKVGSPPMRDPLTRQSGQPSSLKTTPLGASPAHVESSIGERIRGGALHSQRNALRARSMSSSLPVQDLDDRFGLESDLIPTDLHDEVLTPSEKLRRQSRPDEQLSGSFRDRPEGLAIPRRSSNVGGSPAGGAAGSPSRFRAIFEEQQRERGTSFSGTGHVGSPLRESWMLDGQTSVSNRHGVQIGGISQSMARMELNRADSTESNGQRITLGTAPSGLRGAGYSRIDRQISSPGLTSRRIDEEGEDAFFPMDTDSTRRALPTWIDNQNVNSKKVSREENAIQARGNRPIFGFQP